MIGACAVGSAADEPLLYYMDGDRVVFTNTPSRVDARTVPGMPGSAGIGAGSNLLPATQFDPYIDRVARENGLSPTLVKAVALVESGLDPRAVSPKGAQGLMQLMPATARQYGVDDAFDPLENLRAGARHLRGLLDEFGGNLSLALAAYNAGAGAVRRHGGIPAYPETQNYVQKVHDTLGRRAPGASTRRSIAASGKAVRMTRESDGTLRLEN